MGLQRHREDFGQTLGRWGVGTGPYLVLPIIGPSTLRDGGAKLVDVATGPLRAVEDDAIRIGIGVLDRVDARSRQPDLSGRWGDDPYAYLREGYPRAESGRYRGRSGDRNSLSAPTMGDFLRETTGLKSYANFEKSALNPTPCGL